MIKISLGKGSVLGFFFLKCELIFTEKTLQIKERPLNLFSFIFASFLWISVQQEQSALTSKNPAVWCSRQTNNEGETGKVKYPSKSELFIKMCSTECQQNSFQNGSFIV